MEYIQIATAVFNFALLVCLIVALYFAYKKIEMQREMLTDTAIKIVELNRKLRFYKSYCEELEQIKLKDEEQDEKD